MRLPIVRRALRALASRRAWVGRLEPASLLRFGGWVAMLAVLEALGRFSPSDWIDAFGVLAIGGMAMLVVAGDEARWAARLVALRGSLSRRFAPLRVRMGLDLRGGPALESGVPRAWAALFAGAIGLLAALWLGRGAWPSGAREVARDASGALYLLGLTVLWIALLGGTLASWAGIVFQSRELLGERAANVASRAAVVALLACSWFLSPIWPLAAALVSLTVYAATVLAVTFDVRILWRYADGPRGVRWSRLGPWDAALVVGAGALLCAPMIVATGERLGGVVADETPLTTFLGSVYAWSAGALACAILWTLAARIGLARLADPARPRPTRVAIGGARDGRELERVAGRLRAAGLEVRTPRRRGSDVRLALVEGEPDPWRPATRGSTISATRGEIEGDELVFRLRRRDQLQRRRELRRGLERLLKGAGARAFENGEGFWIAPHLWFATHLSRDTEEPEGSNVGPPYRRAISRPARQHLHEVLRALDVDLIFLEDGVGWRRFRRVLAMIFEYWDLFGDRRLEDERHFQGLPGVRVLLHDFDLAEPVWRSSYPEPDYEDLGRARVLHVFRDRGEDSEPAWTPDDRSSEPVAPHRPLVLH